jgi:hypothetical protein
MCAVTAVASSDLPESLHAASLARAFAQSHLCAEHGRDAEPAVMLLTSELVTHALLQGSPPVTVTIECEVSQIRISVTDANTDELGSDSMPADLSLTLIQKVSREWGRETTVAGETFWCVVPTGVIPRRRRLSTEPHGVEGPSAR